jgi:serine-type D-Ala-D-Ala carboxypeptidase (penicillin-binding protein 5/6)
VRLRVTCCAAVLVALLPAAPEAPAQERPPACPAVSAPATIVVEVRSHEVVCARRADQRRQVASATKLMTALLVLENERLDRVVRAGGYRAAPVESQIGLRRGERMSVSDLLRGLLLESANDAAATLARAVSGSRAAFVEQMNARARALGLTRTRFEDPIGLGPRNHSSPRDLAALTLVLRRHRFFRRVVDQDVATLESGDRVRVVSNRNDLVRRVPWVSGVKTGHTDAAGYVLVGSGARRRVQLVSVVLGSDSEASRSDDTLELLNWGFGRYRRVSAVESGEAFGTVPIRHRRGAELPVVAGRTVRLTVLRREAEGLRTRVGSLPEEVEGPLARNQRLGTVEVLQGDAVVAEVPLVAAAGVPEAALDQRVKDALTRPLTFVVLLTALACSLLVVRVARRGRRPSRTPEGKPEAA